MEVLQEDIDFLEHYGVLGMHWGVRNASDKWASGSNKHNKVLAREAKRVPKRQARREKERKAAKTAAIGIGIASTVYAGSAIVKHILAKNENIRISNLPPPPIKFKFNASGPGYKIGSDSLSAMNITLNEIMKRRS